MKVKKERSEILITRYNPTFEQGLTDQQAAERRVQGLVNADKTDAGRSYAAIVCKNVFTFFNLLCFAVAAVLMCFGLFKDCFFLVIVLANCLIAIVQEVRAKKTVEKLSIMTSPTADVVREGREINIQISDVVLDDVCAYRRDRQIAADGVVIAGEFYVNESMLTGESDDVLKRVGDTVFAGSFVTAGSGFVRCEHVGRDNYISTLSARAKKLKGNDSPILKTLNSIIKLIAVIIIPLGVAVAVNRYISHLSTVNIVGAAAGAVIGMIPSGMFLLTSATLAVGVIKLALKKTLVQDLYSIEMLARCDVLCLDKTGTITDGTMTVGGVVPLSGEDAADIIPTLLAATGDTNSTAVALKEYFTGSPHEFASGEAFSSKTKYSSVTMVDGVKYVLGAPEFVMKDMDDGILDQIHEFAANGMRVLLLAKTDGEVFSPVSILYLSDTIRHSAADTIRWFKENDVNICIISGDNPVTVSHIARRVGVDHADRFISLDGMTDEEVASVASAYTIFGRVSPTQKAVLVSAMKRAGKTVAMTGDGVNDILAFKEADCSITVASGSDAARSVASLVLLDSDFNNLPTVVGEGRRVVNNIQKASSMYLMKTLFVMLVTLITLGGYTFYPRHLSLLGLTVIGVPTFFLAMQPNSSKIEGNFLVSILKSAVPSGLVLVINFMAMWGLAKIVGMQGDVLLTMQALAVTLSGLAMLTIVCFPYNRYRLILVLLMAVLTVLVAVLFGWFYEFASLNLWQLGVLVGCFAVSVPLGIGLHIASNRIFKPLSEKLEMRRMKQSAGGDSQEAGCFEEKEK